MNQQVVPSTSQEIREFIVRHFEDFVDKQDPTTIQRNVSPRYIDHDAEERVPIDLMKATEQAKLLFKRFPDVKVDVRDVLADGDKVVVRNVWSATDAQTGKRIEFHGFVLFRIEDGKLIERWATTTEPAELLKEPLPW